MKLGFYGTPRSPRPHVIKYYTIPKYPIEWKDWYCPIPNIGDNKSLPIVARNAPTKAVLCRMERNGEYLVDVLSVSNGVDVNVDELCFYVVSEFRHDKGGELPGLPGVNSVLDSYGWDAVVDFKCEKYVSSSNLFYMREPIVELIRGLIGVGV